MGLGKLFACVAGGVVTALAAPFVLPVAAAVGAAALATGGAVAAAGGAAAAAAGGAAAAAGGGVLAAVGSTAVGGAVIGASSAVGSAVVAGGAAVGGMTIGAATATGSALAGSTIGSAVIGTASAVGGAASSAAGVATALGSSVSAGITATTGLTHAAILSKTAAAVIGTSATYTGVTVKEGFDNIKEAKSLMAEAEHLEGQSRELFEFRAAATAARLERLLVRRAEVYESSITPSIAVIRKFQAVNETDFQDDDTLAILNLLTPEGVQVELETSSQANRILQESRKGLSIAHSALAGTLAFTTQFGVASTGTAISTLSGAAHTNAMLAALGGGAIKASGGGMVLGSAVLGGVVVLPASMVLAYRFASKSEKELTAAHKHYASVAENAGRYRIAGAALRAVNRRTREIDYSMTRLAEIYMKSVFPRLESVYASNRRPDGSVHCPSLPEKDRMTMRISLQMLRSVKQIIAAKVLDKEGFASEESARAVVGAMALTEAARA